MTSRTYATSEQTTTLAFQYNQQLNWQSADSLFSQHTGFQDKSKCLYRYTVRGVRGAWGRWEAPFLVKYYILSSAKHSLWQVLNSTDRSGTVDCLFMLKLPTFSQLLAPLKTQSKGNAFLSYIKIQWHFILIISNKWHILLLKLWLRAGRYARKIISSYF